MLQKCVCVCRHTRWTEPNKINFSGRGDYFPLTSKIWHEETENGYFMRDIEDKDKVWIADGLTHTHIAGQDQTRRSKTEWRKSSMLTNDELLTDFSNRQWWNMANLCSKSHGEREREEEREWSQRVCRTGGVDGKKQMISGSQLCYRTLWCVLSGKAEH